MAKRVFKTTRKLSGGRSVYRKWAEWENGDIIIGKYVGSTTDRYKKPNWQIEVVEAFFADKKAAKNLIDKQIGLNSSGQLDKAMAQVSEGDMVQISYNGMEEMQGGPYAGKDAHLIGVDLVTEDGGEEEEVEEDEESDDDDL